jgi:hypothetical protein
MFTQAQATAFREKIIKEVPHIDVQINAEESPYPSEYYLVISSAGKIRFVVRDEAQWQERKHLVIDR